MSTNRTLDFGRGRVNRETRTLRVIDNPTETQLASTVIKCPGINAIPNKTILFIKDGLYYRPHNSAKIINVADNGDRN